MTHSEAMEFIQREWERVWMAKSSLEQRAITLITASGVLVTLSFGFSAAVAKGTHFANFTRPERIVLVTALGFFAFSALTALFVNEPEGYSAPEVDDLITLPANSQFMARQRLSGAIDKARMANGDKATMLVAALWLQLAGIALLAVAVGLVVA
jgi:hypothetical protein